MNKMRKINIGPMPRSVKNIFKYFYVVELAGKYCSNCTLCGLELKGMPNASFLKGHLRKYHPIVFKVIDRYKSGKMKMNRKTSSEDKNIKCLEEMRSPTEEENCLSSEAKLLRISGHCIQSFESNSLPSAEAITSRSFELNCSSTEAIILRSSEVDNNPSLESHNPLYSKAYDFHTPETKGLQVSESSMPKSYSSKENRSSSSKNVTRSSKPRVLQSSEGKRFKQNRHPASELKDSQSSETNVKQSDKHTMPGMSKELQRLQFHGAGPKMTVFERQEPLASERRSKRMTCKKRYCISSDSESSGEDDGNTVNFSTTANKISSKKLSMRAGPPATQRQISNSKRTSVSRSGENGVAERPSLNLVIRKCNGLPVATNTTLGAAPSPSTEFTLATKDSSSEAKINCNASEASSNEPKATSNTRETCNEMKTFSDTSDINSPEMEIISNENIISEESEIITRVAPELLPEDETNCDGGERTNSSSSSSVVNDFIQRMRLTLSSSEISLKGSFIFVEKASCEHSTLSVASRKQMKKFLTNLKPFEILFRYGEPPFSETDDLCMGMRCASQKLKCSLYVMFCLFTDSDQQLQYNVCATTQKILFYIMMYKFTRKRRLPGAFTEVIKEILGHVDVPSWRSMPELKNLSSVTFSDNNLDIFI